MPDVENFAALVDRRHPDYGTMRSHWDFCESSYRGGRAWFGENVFKYRKEGEEEFKDRVKRAYRFNHTREVVDLINKYVFKGEIVRSQNAPEQVRSFWKNATRRGEDIDSLMRQAGRMMSVFGMPWMVVDTTAKAPEDGGPITMRDMAAADARVFAYVVKPQNVLDMSLDDTGELNWILIYENVREDGDFFQELFEDRHRFRLWTRDAWFLFETQDEEQVTTTAGSKGTARKIVTMIDTGQHDLGIVPVVPLPDREADSEYWAPGLIDDIAYLDRAVANYLSNLDAIIQDQTFSQLVIPAQNMMPGEDDYNKAIEMGTKRVFIYDGEGGKGPEYISPDVKQAEMIVVAITKIITEIYHSVGMAGERTKMDNAAGIDNSSGVAKAYDFDRMNTMLKAKADRLQDVENRIAKIVMAWHGARFDEQVVTYPDEFDTRGLYDEFDIANRLTLLNAPDEIRRYQVERLIEKMFPQLPQDVVKRLKVELKDWPFDTVAITGSLGEPDPGAPVKGPASANQNRQGQNNTAE